MTAEKLKNTRRFILSVSVVVALMFTWLDMGSWLIEGGRGLIGSGMRIVLDVGEDAWSVLSDRILSVLRW